MSDRYSTLAPVLWPGLKIASQVQIIFLRCGEAWKMLSMLVCIYKKHRRNIKTQNLLGLFAPRVNRDEQRRRRSSLGRGRIPPDRLLCVRESSYRRPSVLGAGSAPDFRPPWYDTQRSPRGPRTS